MAQAKASQQFRKLNTLESVIINAEDSADDARYQQASIVADLLTGTKKNTRARGERLREIAAAWTNGRTKEPYHESHVRFCADLWERFGKANLAERPPWTTAYYTVQKNADELVEPEQRRSEWTQAHEARAPKTTETAERLVQNLMDAPPGVVDTVYQGLREVREQRYQPPQERERRHKEADAWAKQRTEPIIDAMTKTSIDLLLEQLLEELRDLSGLDAEERDRYLARLDEVRTEVEVKYAMRGVR